MDSEDDGPSTSSDSKSSRLKTNNAFQVNTGLIPQANLEEQENELQQLGLSVFNQDVFEQGISFYDNYSVESVIKLY